VTQQATVTYLELELNIRLEQGFLWAHAYRRAQNFAGSSNIQPPDLETREQDPELAEREQFVWYNADGCLEDLSCAFVVL